MNKFTLVFETIIKLGVGKSINSHSFFLTLNIYFFSISSVTVLQIFENCDLISVYYCDFGKIDVINISNMRKLPDELKVLPEQAVLAKLHGKFTS